MNQKKEPYFFDGTVGTTTQAKVWDFDSIWISNDSVNDLFYSINGSTFQKLMKGEWIQMDNFAEGRNFRYYASGVNTSIRFSLWEQKAR